MIKRIIGIRLKVERAKKHIFGLETLIRDFTQSEPYTIGAKPHPVKEIEHTTLYVASVEGIPNEIPLIIGDAIHNLRCSLDHLIWQLVEAGGGTPNRDTYFPICDKSTQQYASAIVKGEIHKIGIGAEKILSMVQPYLSGDNTLSLIHALDICDKHRLLLAVALGFGKWGVNISTLRHTFWVPESGLVPLEAGQDIVSIPTSTYNQQPHQDFKLAVDIAFGEPGILHGKSVLKTLNYMADFTDTIITQFEQFLL